MVADNPETAEHAHGAVASETRQIFENLKLLLESAGSSLDRLIQVHAMIYDRIEYDVLNQVYRQYVPNGPPARTGRSIPDQASITSTGEMSADFIVPMPAPSPSAILGI